MHRLNRLTSGCNRLDHRCRTGNRIAGRKYMRNGCLHGLRMYRKRTPGGQVRTFVFRDPINIHPLADGADNRVTFDQELRTFHRHRTAPSAGIWRSEFGFDAFQAADCAVITNDTHRRRQIVDVDPFCQGVFNFLGIGRHFVAGAPVNHRHGIAAQAFSDSGSVNGDVAAADNGNMLARSRAVSQIDFLQKVNCIEYAAEIFFTRNIDIQTFMGAGCQENGTVSFCFETLKGKVPAEAFIHFCLNAQPEDIADLFVQYFRGQAVIGNADPEHTAQFWKGFKNCDRITFEPQVIGYRQPGRSGRSPSATSTSRAGPRPSAS